MADSPEVKDQPQEPAEVKDEIKDLPEREAKPGEPAQTQDKQDNDVKGGGFWGNTWIRR